MKKFVCSSMRSSLFSSGLFLMALSFSSCLSSHATVGIPAREEFVLGEGQNTGYKAQLKNLSNSEVKISGVDKSSGEKTFGFGLDGKGDTAVSVSRNEKVILANPTDKDVSVKVKLSRTVQGMRYQPVNSESN